MAICTALTARVDLEYPIVVAPMHGIAGGHGATRATPPLPPADIARLGDAAAQLAA